MQENYMNAIHSREKSDASLFRKIRTYDDLLSVEAAAGLLRCLPSQVRDALERRVVGFVGDYKIFPSSIPRIKNALKL